jgi:hypothetical protein
LVAPVCSDYPNFDKALRNVNAHAFERSEDTLGDICNVESITKALKELGMIASYMQKRFTVPRIEGCKLRREIPVWTDKHLPVFVQHGSNEAEAAVANTHHVAVTQHEEVDIKL